MSQRGVKRFLDEMQKDSSLRASFNNVVAQLAQDNGFDVDAHDVNDNISSYFKPSAEPPKTDFSKLGPIATTKAIGEEDFKGKDPNRAPPSVTLAIGEEDRNRDIHPTEAVGEDMYGRIPGADFTTLADGEEDKKPAPANDPNKEFSVTCAIGEEDKKSAPPKDEPRMTTLAVGEEGERSPFIVTDGSKLPPDVDRLDKDLRSGATTLALGEEDKKPTPPKDEPRMTTLAVGEEGGRGKLIATDGSNLPPDVADLDKKIRSGATTLALGEEGNKPRRPKDDMPRATTMALGEEGGGIRKPSVGVGGGGAISSASVGEEEYKGGRITSAAKGEEDGQKPPSIKRYIIPREDENGKTGPDVTSMSLGEEEPRKKKPSGPKPK